ncbi:unnamed protein product, partial [Rotaria sordida]
MPTYNLQPMNLSAIPVVRPSNENMNYQYSILQNENSTNPSEHTILPLPSTIYTQPTSQITIPQNIQQSTVNSSTV